MKQWIEAPKPYQEITSAYSEIIYSRTTLSKSANKIYQSYVANTDFTGILLTISNSNTDTLKELLAYFLVQSQSKHFKETFLPHMMTWNPHSHVGRYLLIMNQGESDY